MRALRSREATRQSYSWGAQHPENEPGRFVQQAMVLWVPWALVGAAKIDDSSGEEQHDTDVWSWPRQCRIQFDLPAYQSQAPKALSLRRSPLMLSPVIVTSHGSALPR